MSNARPIFSFPLFFPVFVVVVFSWLSYMINEGLGKK